MLASIPSFILLKCVFLENSQGIRKFEARLLHLEVKSTLGLSIVVGRLDGIDSGNGVFIVVVEVLDLRVSNQGLLWLLAFFVKDTEVVPDLWLEGVQRSGFYDVLERIRVVSILVVNDREGGPIGGFSWIFEGCLLQVLKGFLVVAESHLASALDVKSVSLERIELLNLVDVLQGLVDFSLLEAAPSHVQVDLVVGLVCDGGSFVLSHSLGVVLEYLV